MSNLKGICPKCSSENEYSKTVCDVCGARLPWASALEEDRKQRIVAQQAAEDANKAAVLAQKQATIAATKAADIDRIQQMRANVPVRLQDGQGQCICASCGRVGAPKKYQQGNDFIGGLLAFFFCIIPGIIYIWWNSTTRYVGCAFCQGRDIFEINSPQGKMHVARFYPNGFTF